MKFREGCYWAQSDPVGKPPGPLLNFHQQADASLLVEEIEGIRSSSFRRHDRHWMIHLTDPFFAQLTRIVVAPSPDRPVAAQGGGIAITRSDLDHVGQSLHRRWIVTLGVAFINAELTGVIGGVSPNRRNFRQPFFS